jgi:hypothetical protein
MMHIIRFPLCLLPLFVVAGCSTAQDQFPSLERRAYESDNPLPPVDNVVAAPLSLPAALAAQVDALIRRHTAAQTQFAKTLPSVRTVASNSAGRSPGSESWVNAHLQLSRLDKARADSVSVVRDFDTLISQQSDADSALVPLLTDAQKIVADSVSAQNAEIERLSQLIGE